MIHLYSWPTPNGQKIQILLEELRALYVAVPVNILQGEQFEPGFLAISPNNKVPAMVDTDADGQGTRISLFETGAILLYLAEKYRQFIPDTQAGRADVLQWLFFQTSSLGPMLGQATHFLRYAAETVPYAVQRYSAEAERLYGVLEKQLQGRDWLAANAYTIADIGSFPWVCRHHRQGIEIDDYPNVKAWLERISSRPAVIQGMDVLKSVARDVPLDEQAHRTLFKS